ncbi:beta-ketoacyl-[acyl-carrier-protein] synthase family protein [Streptomyces sp. RS10V-4]|uniref:beta-ketoacyl-[acyl-carrier-protein] synthase family protein n=1 Tax=Streptomyces rhizoryzae TaxID=2932493 RepID=UPI002005BE71|nr:beta-ketoacyl-[acyl-carrier-protein] synthase family protein [Streptomyces rhizoryzae]MCK7624539.1 beta-ketoacyl-[acyl-carrier-protein] synthase family protein [Streptomyces rhizoryzae]
MTPLIPNGAGHEVVVTGVGLVAGHLTDPEALFDHLAEGRTLITEHPRHAEWGVPCAVSAHIDPQVWQRLTEALPAEAGPLGPAGVLAWHAAAQAWERSGLPRRLETDRGGVFLACNRMLMEPEELTALAAHVDHEAGVLDLDGYLERPGADGPDGEARRHERVQPDTATAALADYFGAAGVLETHADACAAGGMAVGSAYRYIRSGALDVALAGGAESLTTLAAVTAFHQVGALAPAEGRDPAEISRPFDKDRNGFVIGDGAAFLVLESRAHAEARGARILATVAGYAGVTEAVKMTSSSRDGADYAECMRAALADAGLTPDAIDHINAHGTATQANDTCEAAALHTVFGERAAHLPVTGNKSALGHSLANSGAAEAVLSVLSLQRQTLLPTLNFTEPDEVTAGLDVVTERRPARVTAVLSNSFGFGGQNCSLILAEAGGARR